MYKIPGGDGAARPCPGAMGWPGTGVTQFICINIYVEDARAPGPAEPKKQTRREQLTYFINEIWSKSTQTFSFS